MKGWFWIPIVGLALLLIASFALMETVSPRDLTVTRIRITEMRIKSYWKANRQLPGSLSALPILQGRDNSTIDGWGKPIEYEITGATTVTLSSGRADDATGRTRHEAIVVAFDVNKDE